MKFSLNKSVDEICLHFRNLIAEAIKIFMHLQEETKAKLNIYERIKN